MVVFIARTLNTTKREGEQRQHDTPAVDTPAPFAVLVCKTSVKYGSTYAKYGALLDLLDHLLLLVLSDLPARLRATCYDCTTKQAATTRETTWQLAAFGETEHCGASSRNVPCYSLVKYFS
jgi:hypothetical protein